MITVNIKIFPSCALCLYRMFYEPWDTEATNSRSVGSANCYGIDSAPYQTGTEKEQKTEVTRN